MPAWKNITIELPNRDLKNISERLDDMNRVLAVTVTDKLSEKDSTWVDDPENPFSLNGNTHSLSILTSAFTDSKKLILDISKKLDIKRKINFYEEIFEDRDWIKYSKSQFKEIKISNILRIIPPWIPNTNFPGKTIVIEPGSGFGTGSHSTTKMCLNWISIYLEKTESVLDFGCGSGILSITSKLFGATKVVGIDIESLAIDNANRNQQINKTNINFLHLNDFIIDYKFDVIIANILSNTIISLKNTFLSSISNDGKLLLTGILEDQASIVINKFNPEFRLSIIDKSDGWVLLLGEKTS